jgi:hypothetical protein
MSDHGGRAPDPSDLGSDWVEALLGEPPTRSSADVSLAPTPVAPADEPLELGSLAMAEALLGDRPPSTTSDAPQAPAATPVAEPPVSPPAPAWAEPPLPDSPPAPRGLGGTLLPPDLPAAPTWAGRGGDDAAWAPDAADDGWTSPTPVSAERAEPPALVFPEAEPIETAEPIGSVAPSEPVFDDQWSNLPPLVPEAPAAFDDPDTAAGPRSGLPYLGIEPNAPGASTPPPPPPSDAPDPPSTSGVLIDPSAPGTTPSGPSGAAAGFLDLRPSVATPVPTAAAAAAAGGKPPKVRGRGKAKVRTPGDRRRRRLLGGIGVVLVIVFGLAAAQVISEGDGEPDAVLTADAASIENDDGDDERSISVGTGEDEAAEAEDTKDEAAEASGDDGVVEGNTATTDAAAGAAGGGSSGGSSTPSGPGRIVVSASSLEFGSSGSRSVSIRNEGGSSIGWSASTSGAGYGVPGTSSGNLSPGQAVDIPVSFSPNGLPEGTASGTLSIGGRAVALRATVNRPPTISNVSWASCAATSRLRMTVTDESGVASVVVAGTSPSGPGFRKTAVSQGSGSYRADIGPFSSNGQITYFVEATDSRGNVARSAVQYRAWNNGC